MQGQGVLACAFPDFMASKLKIGHCRAFPLLATRENLEHKTSVRLPSQVMSDDQNSIPPEPSPVPRQTEGQALASGVIPGLLRAGMPSRNGDWQPPTPEELHVRLPQYDVTELIGRGGMGAVYKGWQKSLGRFVAIKILPTGHDGGDAEFAARFKREAAALAQLRHPGIIPVHDAGEKPDGLLYFVMDFVAGADLQKKLSSRGRLPVEEALSITVHVLDALAYAHERGIIHRDIKPANIMVDDKGRVLVADFGLAKSTVAGPTRLTSSHVTIGTPDFMAPEALKCAADVDHRADLFAVGVMLYEMLTGQLPRGRFEPPSRAVPGLDRRLDRIVDRALQSDRDARYQSAAEFRDDVKAVLARLGARQTAVTRPAQRTVAQRSVARRKTAPAAPAPSRSKPLLIGVIAAVIFGMGSWLGWKMIHPGTRIVGGIPPAISPGTGGTSPAASTAPWRNAFVEPPLSEFIKNAPHTAQGYLLPMGNHWKYPAQAVSAGALRVRATSEDSRMILNFHHDDGGAGGAARVFFRPGKCILAYNLRIDVPNTLLAEKEDVNLGSSAHDFLLIRLAGRLHVVLDGRTIIEAADPNPAPGRFSLECGADNRLHAEKVEYLLLDGVPEASALKLLGLPVP